MNDTTPDDAPPHTGTSHPARDRLVLAAVLAGAILLDQVTKATASTTVVNEAGTSYLLPQPVRMLWAHPHVGAALDLLDLAPLLLLLALAVRATDRRVQLGWGLLAAGWASNWLDRIGLSALTQPGSPRGAIDWVRLPGVPGIYNLADGVILTGGLLLAGVAISRVGRGRPVLVGTACLCLLALWVGIWSGNRRASELEATADQLHRPAMSMAQEQEVLSRRIERARAASRQAQRNAARAALAARVAGSPNAKALLPAWHHFACAGPHRCVVTRTTGPDVTLVYPVHRPPWAERIGVPPGPCDGILDERSCRDAAVSTGAVP
jgi:lipoprotein signal peptidase